MILTSTAHSRLTTPLVLLKQAKLMHQEPPLFQICSCQVFDVAFLICFKRFVRSISDQTIPRHVSILVKSVPCSIASNSRRCATQLSGNGVDDFPGKGIISRKKEISN